jgi:hypothetical protein
MTEAPKQKRPLGVYPVILWMAINVFLLLNMTLSHPEQPDSYIEVALWIPSIAGLWLMKKWGVALSAAVLCIALGISMGNVLSAYYTAQLAFVPVNTLRIILNAAATVYLFKCVFASKFS